MKKSITPSEIRQTNRQRIYQYIYQKESVAQQDIAYDLHLSRPTITTNLNALKEEGLIREAGQIENEVVGRKPSAYAIQPQYRVSIGVELLSHLIKIIAIDLYGRKIDRTVFAIDFQPTDAYFKAVCARILQFKDDCQFCDEQVLGAGFAMQGLISSDGQRVIYGKILDCTGLHVSAVQQYLPYPCRFAHDADSAAIAELWAAPGLDDAFYLSLSRHLAAALILDRKIITGRHGHSATIEHIQMDPDGARCYCGKRGCLETLCSLRTLQWDLEDLDAFFEKVRAADRRAQEIWITYLKNLARAINMLHLIYDKTFILGGYLAPYLQQADIDYLYQEIAEQTPFSEAHDFLEVSRMPKHNITIGAALPYVQAFLEKI